MMCHRILSYLECFINILRQEPINKNICLFETTRFVSTLAISIVDLWPIDWSPLLVWSTAAASYSEDILVFLTGQEEIESAVKSIKDIAQDLSQGMSSKDGTKIDSY